MQQGFISPNIDWFLYSQNGKYILPKPILIYGLLCINERKFDMSHWVKKMADICSQEKKRRKCHNFNLIFRLLPPFMIILMTCFIRLMKCYMVIIITYVLHVNRSFVNYWFDSKILRGRRGHDRMIVGFITTYAICAHHHWCCEFKSRSGRDVQHYVIKFVSDLRQVSGLLRFPPSIKLTATI
jgi:hypothetical protein